MGRAWWLEGTRLYNDAYGALLGDRHPAALGQPFDEAWRSASSALGGPFRQCMEGASTLDEDQPISVERHGATEQAFVTSTFSPIVDEAGKVDGVLHSMVDTTAKVRQLAALTESDRGKTAVTATVSAAV